MNVAVRRRIQLAAAALMTLTAGFLWLKAAERTQGPATDPATLMPYFENLGVEVSWQTPIDRFPEFELTQPHAVPLRAATAARALEALREALQRYPAALLRDHLSGVYLYERFWIYGVEFGGTRADRAVILSAGRVGDAASNSYFRETFHHEFSSVLIADEAMGFPSLDWLRALPEGFAYLSEQPNGVQKELAAVRDGVQASAEDLLRQGFVRPYGTSSFHNDVNTYVELLFMQPGRLRALAAEHPRVAAKCRLLTGFYRKLGVSVEGCGGGLAALRKTPSVEVSSSRGPGA